MPKTTSALIDEMRESLMAEHAREARATECEGILAEAACERAASAMVEQEELFHARVRELRVSTLSSIVALGEAGLREALSATERICGGKAMSPSASPRSMQWAIGIAREEGEDILRGARERMDEVVSCNVAHARLGLSMLERAVAAARAKLVAELERDCSGDMAAAVEDEASALIERVGRRRAGDRRGGDKHA